MALAPWTKPAGKAVYELTRATTQAFNELEEEFLAADFESDRVQ
jgi:hypothetical protein